MVLNSEKRIGKKLKIGMIFPGQGSQYLGMGKEFYDQDRTCQEMFEDASNALKENCVKLCFSSSDKILQGTIVTQTGIFLVSAAIYTILANKYGLVPDLAAGHSLGEYTAVYAAKGLDFFDAIYLLSKRAQFMERGMEKQEGGLLAVMNLDLRVLQAICDRYDDANASVAEIAIFNSPTQVVVSGTLHELKMIAEEVEIMHGKAIFLPVAGAYHSRMMRDAEQDFAPYLVKVDFHRLAFPIINNIMALKVVTPEEIKLSLVKQTSSHIYWWTSMEKFKDMDLVIQVGPNDKFAKLLRREWPNFPVYAINSYQDIDTVLKVIENKESEG